MASKEYKLLPGEGSIDEPFTHDDDEHLGFDKRRLLVSWIVFTMFALSIAANAFLVVWHFAYAPQKSFSGRTAFGRVNLELYIAQLINR